MAKLVAFHKIQAVTVEIESRWEDFSGRKFNEHQFFVFRKALL